MVVSRFGQVVKVERKAGPCWGCGVVVCCVTPEPGEEKALPCTWGWDSILRPSLGYHVWPWSSHPLNRDRMNQRGPSPGLSADTSPLEGTESRRGGPPACLCHHTSPSRLGSHPSPAAIAMGTPQVTTIPPCTAWQAVNREINGKPEAGQLPSAATGHQAPPASLTLT